jgi:hypothetical protein
LFTSIVFAALAVFASRASAQANVVENQTTLLYVDASAGSDSNSGAQSAPFQTIQAAVNKANTLNQQSIGVKASVVTLKPAICGHFKTGHSDWPKT